jgi:drug/metabolite transporter (DMT)-like permease
MMDSSRLMLLYSLTTLIFLLPGSISTFAISPGATGVAFFYSIAFFSCIFACIPALRLGQLSTVTAFTVTGAIVIPFFYGVFFLSEELTSQKLIGMVIICLSLVPSYISDSRKKTPETSNRFSDKFIYIILCILIFAGNGAVGVAIKLLSIKAPDETINNFLILTAIIRLLMLIPVFATITLLRRLPKKIKNFTEPYNAYIRKRSLKKLFIPAMFGCLYALSNAQ